MNIPHRSLTIFSTSLFIAYAICSCSSPKPSFVKIKTIVQSGNEVATLPYIIISADGTATIGAQGNIARKRLSNNIRMEFKTTTLANKMIYEGEITDLRQNSKKHFGPFSVDGQTHIVELDKQSNLSLKADLVNKDGSLVE